MFDPAMPLIMRIMGRFGTTPELASRNAVRILTADSVALKGVIVPTSRVFERRPLKLASADAQRLWAIITDIAAERGLALP